MIDCPIPNGQIQTFHMEVVLIGLHGLNYFNQKFKRRYEVGMICDWESPGENWRESTKWLGSRHIVSKVKTITRWGE